MLPNSSIPIFIINLDSRFDRLKKISSRLGNLPFIRIAAINGSNLDEQEHLKRTVKDRMSKNEIACILSHRLVWQKMADEKMSYACVLEDDAVLSSSFPHYINNSEWLPENFNLIRIETFMARVFLSRRKIPAGDRLLRQLGSMHAGTAGYIVSLKGAVNLLDKTQFPDSPLDHLMFESTSINSEFKVLQMCPALCVQEDVLCPDTSESGDIAEMRSRVRPKEKIDFIQKLWRETKRPFMQLLSLLRVVRENLIIVRYVPFV